MHKKRLLYGVILLVILFAVGLVTAQPAAQDRNNVTVIGGDEAQLRQLITHLANDVSYGSEVTVVVGQLPETLPFTLPVADNSTIIGGIDRSFFNRIEVWLHSPQSIQAVIDFYTEQLTKSGWVMSEAGYFGGTGGGFSATTTSAAGFCSEEFSASLVIHMQEKEEVGTVITLYIDQNYPTSFCMTDSPEEETADVFRLLPSLVPPPGMTIRRDTGGGGGGGGPTPLTASTTAVLITEMTADEIHPLYDAQLEKAGWGPVASGGDAKAAWSTWIFQTEDGAWSGMLTLTQMPTVATEYFALLRIEQLDDSP